MTARAIQCCGIAVMLGITGCAGLSVHKAGDSKGDTAKGQSFFLPRVVMNLVPDEELGYRVEWKYLPDPKQEYRIAHFATWANAELTIATEGGLLKSIKSDAAADTVAAEALKGYGEIRKAEEAAEFAVASALRTAADTKLAAAKTERDALQNQFNTAETSLQTAKTNLQKHQIDLFAAQEKEKLARQRKTDAEDTLKALVAAGTDKQAIAAARTALDSAATALIDAEVVRQRAEADLQSDQETLATAQAKHTELQGKLAQAQDRVTQLDESLPRKPVQVPTADVADTGTGPANGTDGPVMFAVKFASNNVELVPLNVEIEARSAWTRAPIALAANAPAGEAPACPKGDEKKITVEQRPGGALYGLSAELGCVLASVEQVQVQLNSVDAAGNTEKLGPLAQVKGDPVANQFRVNIKDGKTFIDVAVPTSVVDAKCKTPQKCQLTVKAHAGSDAPSVTYSDVMSHMKQ